MSGKKYTIHDMQAFAVTKNGQCLSEVYLGIHTSLESVCAYGHHWQARPSNIQSGTWCPACANNISKTMEDMRHLAASKHGKCLSAKYINSHTLLEWECHLGHIWQAEPNNVKNGTWCPYCIGRYKTLEDLSCFAARHNGKCLAGTYLGSKILHEWECKKGHRWHASPQNIQQGHWCPVCST